MYSMQGHRVAENGRGGLQGKSGQLRTEITPSILCTYMSNIINAETMDKSQIPRMFHAKMQDYSI